MLGMTQASPHSPPAISPSAVATFRCAICEQTESPGRVVYPADPHERPFDLVRCLRCGLVQQWPRYSDRELAALYDRQYYVFGEDDSARWARAVQQYVVHVLPWERRQYSRLLEIGSALGHFTALAAQRGWRVVGLDLSPEAVSEAAARFGLDFRAGPLRRHRSALPPFDLVFVGDVIEHVPSPIELLREVYSVLAPGGILCLDTPNFASGWRLIGGRRWLGLNRYHINLFEARTLERVLSSCGYLDIRLGSYTHYRYESWAARPELQRWIRLLPKALAWRVNRFLDRRSRRSPWRILHDKSPDSAEKAAAVVARLAGTATAGPGHRGDNLIAVARRPTSD